MKSNPRLTHPRSASLPRERPSDSATAAPDASSPESIAGDQRASRPHLPAISEYLSRLPLHRRSHAATWPDPEAERLLSLKEGPPGEDITDTAAATVSTVDPGPPHDTAPPAQGPCVVFDSGPLAGTTLSIPHENDVEGLDVHLSDDDGAQTDLRVVRRGDAYMLVHLDGPPATVGGQEMLLRVLVLEDGDTICAGATAARFITAPA